jgi:hypothetical protein
MNKYLTLIHAHGQLIKTVIYADSAIHARLLGQWHYGFSSVPAMPTKLDEAGTLKPPTPEQLRLDALKRQKDNVGRTLDAERKRQKVNKAQQNLSKALLT